MNPLLGVLVSTLEDKCDLSGEDPGKDEWEKINERAMFQVEA